MLFYNPGVNGSKAAAAAPSHDGNPELSRVIAEHIARAGGWLPFDRYMALALYTPGLGYYSRSSRQFGSLPSSGSDFVTAPELSPLFGAALARAVAQALQVAGADTVFEFGAGSGALAEQVLDALDSGGQPLKQYRIVDLSGALRARQAQRLARFGARVQWLDTWPDTMHGVVLGNEVLDAMPVQLLHFDGQQWFERGVRVAAEGLAFEDRPTSLRPPHPGPFLPGTVTEIHRQAEAFMRSLADRLRHGAAYFIDYGFPEAEYYHPQRHQGTLVAHRAHRTELDAAAVLREPGLKDITAHVNFSALALAAQDAGLQVLGYTSQANFLLNCDILGLLPAGDVRATAALQKLLAEHEMGELFKVLALGRGAGFDGGSATGFEALGFTRGDRSHTL